MKFSPESRERGGLPLAQVRGMAAAGDRDGARAVLREALRRGACGAQELGAAGRLLQKWAADLPPPETLSVVLAGEISTGWIGSALTATAFAGGVEARVVEGGYDTLLQSLDEPRLEGAGVVVLIPWTRRLFADDARSPSERVADEIALMKMAWDRVRARGAALVQVGYDASGPGPEGAHTGLRTGRRALLDEANRAMREQLPPGAYWVDLSLTAGQMGRRAFYSARNDFWTRNPLTEEGTALFARHLWAGIRAVRNQGIKVVVTDLDNTLWGGIVGEVGPLGVELEGTPAGEAHRAFQAFLRGLARRGILLAACSKNNASDALEPFAVNPGMILRREDFAAFAASWHPKPEMIRDLAAELNLGLDAFLFLDDSAFEREAVRQALPQVTVPELPPDPADYIALLEDGFYFESVSLTDEDRERTRQYQAEAMRRSAQETVGSTGQFLVSLRMTARAEPVGPANLTRVVQLVGKTNQFNLTSRRHSRDRIEALIARDGAVHFGVHLKDRFGEYGLIAVLLAEPGEGDASTLRVDTWLMSCRAIGRGVEAFCLRVLVDRARTKGVRRLMGEYVPSPKNTQVAGLYKEFGFQPLGRVDGVERFELLLDRAVMPETFIALEETAGGAKTC